MNLKWYYIGRALRNLGAGPHGIIQYHSGDAFEHWPNASLELPFSIFGIGDETFGCKARLYVRRFPLQVSIADRIALLKHVTKTTL